MQSVTAPQGGALLRHLQLEQIEHVVPDELPGSADARHSVTIVVAELTLARLPATLNEFCRRNDMDLVHHWHAEGGEVFVLSWLNERHRPEFLSLEVRIQRSASALANGWQRRSNRLRRWREPSGMFIACLGPEGSGRTSVIEQLSAHPIAPFRDAHTMELRPRMMRPVPVNPDSRIPRGWLGTMAKLMMFAAD